MMVLPPWFSGMSVAITHAVPQFLRDERQERMEQPQRVRQHKINHRQRVGLARAASVALKKTALLASTYQSQYSLQKKR